MNKKGLMVVLVLSLAINASILGTTGYHYYREIPGGRNPPLAPYRQRTSTFTRNLAFPTLQLGPDGTAGQKFHERLAELRNGHEREE